MQSSDSWRLATKADALLPLLPEQLLRGQMARFILAHELKEERMDRNFGNLTFKQHPRLTRRSFLALGAVAVCSLSSCTQAPLDTPSTEGDAQEIIDEYFEGRSDYVDESEEVEVVEPTRGRAVEGLLAARWTVAEIQELQNANSGALSVVTDEAADLAIAGVSAFTLFVNDGSALRPVAFNEVNSDSRGSYPGNCLPLELLGAGLVSEGRAYTSYPYATEEDFTIDAPDFSIVATLDREADETLIAFNIDLDEPVDFYPVVNMNGPYADGDDQIFRDLTTNPMLEYDFIEDVEMDGTLEATEEALMSAGVSYMPIGESTNFSTGKTNTFYCLASDEPTSVLVGCYEGTSYDERTIWINRQMVLCEEGAAYTAPYVRTKNGYVEIDTSGIPNGSYVVQHGYEACFLNLI